MVELSSVLRGAFAAMTAPQAELGAEFNGARAGGASLMVFLAAQELDRRGATEAENAELAALLIAAGEDGYPVEHGHADADENRRNGTLRQAIIDLHAAVEQRGDAAWHHRLNACYQAMAERWRLDLPG